MQDSQAASTGLEAAYLKIFRYTVITLMTLALLTVVVMLGLATFKQLQSTAPPPVAQKAPEQTIDAQNLKQYLLDVEKRRLLEEQAKLEKEKRKAQGLEPAEGVATIDAAQAKFAAEYEQYVNPLYACVGDFAKATGATVENLTEKQMEEKRTALRKEIVQMSQHQFLGEPWVAAMSQYVCGVMKMPEFINLSKEGKIGSVIRTSIAFHRDAWIKKEEAKYVFEMNEKQRVNEAIAADLARVAAAKLNAIFYLTVAGGAFGLFLILALYLIFAKIENNLALINRSIELRPNGGSFPTN